MESGQLFEMEAGELFETDNVKFFLDESWTVF